MQWSYLSWFLYAVLAAWCGWATVLSVRVLAAVRSATSRRSAETTWERRLTDCESLLTELVAALSRIEARDRMRKVRAGISTAEPHPEPPTPAAAAPLSSLPTTEIRRRLASRQPLT